MHHIINIFNMKLIVEMMLALKIIRLAHPNRQKFFLKPLDKSYRLCYTVIIQSI